MTWQFGYLISFKQSSSMWSASFSLLYNYGMIFFNINHFSLIIFYHSVWLGFELFLVQVHSIGYSLRSRTKDMTIVIVIIKPR